MKNKKQVIFFGALFILSSAVIFIYHNYTAKGATYGWLQTTWTTQTANTADHTVNQTGWTEYSAADPHVATGESVSITTETATLTHTTTDDFSNGAQQGTLTTGDQVSLDLP
ncbi:MAG: hypothetical protein WA019_05535 [Candidatus Moraniibacteriota bacterium]